MPDTVKVQLISAGKTALATFLTVLGTSILSVGTLDWSAAFWGALILAAVRAAIGAGVNTFVPVQLGGRKK